MLTHRDSLTDQVAGVLIDRILEGHYPVGAKLPAGRLLAQEFNVSAAVIREATERLRTKGLVKTRQGAGCIVLADTLDAGFQFESPPRTDREALRHIYELRAGLEGAAAALAALRATQQDLRDMAHILTQLKTALHEPERALELDFAFHRSLAAATHNPHYTQLLGYLSEQWRHSVAVARGHTLALESRDGQSRTQRVHEEHEAIFAAILARDPHAARQRAQEHLQLAGERLGLDVAPCAPSSLSTEIPL